jgi:hypothetical protein
VAHEAGEFELHIKQLLFAAVELLLHGIESAKQTFHPHHPLPLQFPRVARHVRVLTV